MKKGYTHVCIVLDASGSMAPMREDVVGSLRTFAEAQKTHESENDTTILDVYQFSGEVKRIVSSASINLFDPSDYSCSGCTALYDAVCVAVDEVRDKIDAMPKSKQPEDVMLVIVTDGEENSSRHFNRDDVNKRIAAVKELGWEVVFLATDIDVRQAAADIGIDNDDDVFEADREDFGEAMSCVMADRAEMIRERRMMIDFPEIEPIRPDDDSDRDDE